MKVLAGHFWSLTSGTWNEPCQLICSDRRKRSVPGKRPQLQRQWPGGRLKQKFKLKLAKLQLLDKQQRLLRHSKEPKHPLQAGWVFTSALDTGGLGPASTAVYAYSTASVLR
mmetsp:Transcript_71209/g.154765  ORF Transcript_71209/g.154765 Transcript_71209/m.154765 type:complete len:112 (+) Transcript_71209:130-465(+)